MEIKDLKDSYIDLDGDVKATSNNSKIAVFVTDTDKPMSEYRIADKINEIKELLNELNPLFELDIEIYKQYSIKKDKDNNIVGIKVYTNNEDSTDGLNMVLTGYDITVNSVIRDYYFIASIDAVNNFISKHNLNYEVKQYDTHKPFLYSVKYDKDNKIVNFKTYYIINEHAIYYTSEMVPHLKKVLKFV